MQKIRKKIEDKETNDAFKFIEENALGNPIILDQAPTKDQVQANNLAVHETDVYIRTSNGKLLKITTTEVE